MSLGSFSMIVKRCCRTCKQFVSSQDKAFSSCQLRKIKVHSEIATFAFCHHWMKKEAHPSPIKTKHIDKQLDLGKVLEEADNSSCF